MNRLKYGTPAFGIATGAAFTVIGVLLLTIGFWKTLLLVFLFFAGYYVGSTENKLDGIRKTVNRLIPGKTDKAIDLKAEIRAEQKDKIEED